MSKMEVNLLGFEPWAPREQIAPICSGSPSTTLRVASNGSAGCYGGWELRYPADREGEYLQFQVKVRWKNLKYGIGSVTAESNWQGVNDWDPIYTGVSDGEWVTLSQVVKCPVDAECLRVKLMLRWSDTGMVEWKEPLLLPTEAPKPRRIRLGAASLPQDQIPQSVEDNLQQVLTVCRQAAAQHIQLLCLPENALSSRIPRKDGDDAYSHAVTVPGPELAAIGALARSTGMAVCMSVKERHAELLHNTAVLIDKDGGIALKYRKVHLAPPAEAWRGITPGDGFPVGRIQTAQARVGMNICMDSSVEESARCVARNGAEIILMPIAGDYRATLYWEPVPHVFDLRRWEIIHQVRAMDNQVYMVVSRNYGVGTGIFAPDGVTLAMDRGADRIVYADVDLSDLKRVAATFKDKTWYTRREQTYGVLAGQAALTVREDWE
ncbi:MAG: carbon-nitrogen hydrolase family protein [Limnochordia bacterium]